MTIHYKTRRIIQLAALSGVLLAVPIHAKTLKLAYDADPVSLDLHEQLSGGTLQLSHMVCDPLIRWNQDLGFDARVASSWQRQNDTTVRFNLRTGVKFHSGREMTAKDVKFTFDRLKESEDFKGVFANFIEAKVIDDHTIDLITDGPYPLVEHTATYIFPLDSEFYTGTDERGRDKGEIVKHGDSFASANVSCTGPFTVASREQGVKVVFERFADYWDTASPGNVKRIVLTPIKESPTRVAALLSGDIDFAAPIPPTDLVRIDNSDKVDLVTMSGTRIITFQLNQKRRHEFADARVRQAIVHAINNAGIVEKIMKKFGTAAAQQSPKGYLGHNAALAPRYDLEKAKALLAEAGYADGFTVTMMAPNNRYVNDAKIAEAVAGMLAKINIQVDLTTMPKAQYWPKYDERAADIMMIGWHSDTEDSANFSEFLTMTPDEETGYGQYNSGNYSNAEVDRLVLDSAKQTDPAERAQMLQRVEQILYDDAAFVPLHWQDRAWAARKGVHIDKVVNVMNFPYLGDLVMD
ncbi:ABC transporter substrate-binding protein [Candidatus Spongiihabitans sp.]|uniref:ABC transporter substrate-binding protein n=1 Tax=Candidatus Spongiihabitans sp. TaxID=3101308 RepID=UPI003C7D5508